ncbi:hypothetical protein [Halorarius litoreus]|nr:hypothetical protein [Halorarius litoreus]
MSARVTTAIGEYSTRLWHHWCELDRGWKATALGCLLLLATTL